MTRRRGFQPRAKLIDLKHAYKGWLSAWVAQPGLTVWAVTVSPGGSTYYAGELGTDEPLELRTGARGQMVGSRQYVKIAPICRAAIERAKVVG